MIWETTDNQWQVEYYFWQQRKNRKIQEKGLQVAYNNEEDRTVKECNHKLAAESSVLVNDVEASFSPLETPTPIGKVEYIAYFDATYVDGVPARGRQRALASRYAVRLWNQYDFTIEGPPFLKKILKKQGDTEIAEVELFLGRKIKAGAIQE